MLINEHERQPLVRWRAVQIVIAVLVIGGAASLFRAVFSRVSKLPQSSLAYVLPLIVVLHLAYVAYVRVVERRRVTEFAARLAVPHLLLGTLIGAALFCATIFAIYATGGFHIIGTNGWAAALPALGLAIGSGYGEELIMRGVLFRLAEQSLGTWIALALSAAFFGALHGANPHATFVSSAAIALEAGVLLGAAFVRTRTLWLPIAIHFAWNFTQGGIFGAAVSGHTAHGYFASRLSGSPVLSGGAFGAEASVFAVVFCLSAAAVMLVIARRNGEIVQPFWKRR